MKVAPDIALESEKNKLLTQLMPIAVYTTDSIGIITFFNKKAAELWGRSPRLNDPTEMRYCGSWKIFTPEGKLLPHDQCPMAMSLKTGEGFKEREICVEQPDGTRKYALANVDLLYGLDGKITGAINVLYDITDRKRAEEYEMRLAAIVKNSDDAIIGKTLKGIVTSWNYGAEKIFGYKEKEMVGKSIKTLIPPNNHHEEDTILSRISKGEKISHYETIRLRKDGTPLHISLTVSPVRSPNGKIIGASKIARDITEQVKVQKQLEEYAARLEELSRQKDEFIGLASHELKTPLTVTKGFLQLMQMEEGENTYVDKALANVEKLIILISDLLDVSKIGSGKMPFHFEKFDLAELIAEVVENLSFDSQGKSIEWEGGTGPVEVSADKHRIEQVLVNLIGNAIKYSPDAERVLVRMERNNGHARVEVEDFGIGIPLDQQELVFTRFFRAKGVDPSITGLGIGLYISSEIVKRHQGEMGLIDKDGKGSVFYFTIPIKADE